MPSPKKYTDGLLVFSIIAFGAISWWIVSSDTMSRSDGNRRGVDTHVHIGANITSESALAAYKKAAKYLIKKMDASGVQTALLVSVPHRDTNVSGQIVDELVAKTAAEYPDRLRFMAGGGTLNAIIQETKPSDVTQKEREVFRAEALNLLQQGAVGFGEMLTLHVCLGSEHSYQFASPDHPLFLELSDLAAEQNVPIDLHMEAVSEERTTPENLQIACAQNPDTLPATVPALETLLTHNRQARIVWQHIGWDNTGELNADLVHRLLAAHENLFIALRVEERVFQVGTGNQLPMSNRLVDTQGNIIQEWQKVFEAFPDRFMIGSDEFFNASGSIPIGVASFEATWKFLEQLPDDLAKKIESENATRIYRLD